MNGLFSGAAARAALRSAHACLEELTRPSAHRPRRRRRSPGLMAIVDQHAAGIRDSLSADVRPLTAVILAAYAEGVRDAAFKHGWRPPPTRSTGPRTTGCSTGCWRCARSPTPCPDPALTGHTDHFGAGTGLPVPAPPSCPRSVRTVAQRGPNRCRRTHPAGPCSANLGAYGAGESSVWLSRNTSPSDCTPVEILVTSGPPGRLVHEWRGLCAESLMARNAAQARRRDFAAIDASAPGIDGPDSRDLGDLWRAPSLVHECPARPGDSPSV